MNFPPQAARPRSHTNTETAPTTNHWLRTLFADRWALATLGAPLRVHRSPSHRAQEVQRRRAVAALDGGQAKGIQGINSGEPIKVLIVDDNRLNRMLAKRILTEAGCVCSEAGNGREAMDSINADRPDVMLLDIRMPVMDGYEVLDRLKTRGLDKSVQVIASTAENDSVKEDDLIAATHGPSPLPARKKSSTPLLRDRAHSPTPIKIAL